MADVLKYMAVTFNKVGCVSYLYPDHKHFPLMVNRLIENGNPVYVVNNPASCGLAPAGYRPGLYTNVKVRNGMLYLGNYRMQILYSYNV